MRLQFVKSANFPADYPPEDRPEVALVGRSNAGKSSFLNSIAQQRLAFVSQAPGKTTLLNFFEDKERFRLVDMPGYGFAARSQKQRTEWRQMIETYLTDRSNLIGLILVMDIRRSWSEDEQLLRDFIDGHGLKMLVVLTKKDKCKQNEWRQRLRDFKKQLNPIPCFAVSNLKKLGLDEVEKHLVKEWL